MLRSPGACSVLPCAFVAFAKGNGIPWPWSLASQIGLGYRLPICNRHLGTRYVFCIFPHLENKNLLRALIVVFVALGSGNAALPFLVVTLSSLGLRLAHGWFVLVATPGIVALLVGELEILETAESSATPKSLPKS